MNKQTVTFAVKKKDGIVTQIGRSCIPQPKIKFSGGSIKWYEDRGKKKSQDYSNG